MADALVDMTDTMTGGEESLHTCKQLTIDWLEADPGQLQQLLISYLKKGM